MEATYIFQYPLQPQLIKKEQRIWAPNLHRAVQRVRGAEATYWPKQTLSIAAKPSDRGKDAAQKCGSHGTITFITSKEIKRQTHEPNSTCPFQAHPSQKNLAEAESSRVSRHMSDCMAWLEASGYKGEDQEFSQLQPHLLKMLPQQWYSEIKEIQTQRVCIPPWRNGAFPMSEVTPSYQYLRGTSSAGKRKLKLLIALSSEKQKDLYLSTCRIVNSKAVLKKEKSSVPQRPRQRHNPSISINNQGSKVAQKEGKNV